MEEVIDVERELDDTIMSSLIDGSEDEGEENRFQDDPGCKIINCNYTLVEHPTSMTENQRPKFRL